MAEPRNAVYEGIEVEVYNMELMGIHGELVEVYNCWHPELGRFRAYARELKFSSEPFHQAQPVGLVTCEKAAAFVKAHQADTFECAEGLIVKTHGVYPKWCFGDERGDDLYDEELHAFPIVNGMVELAAIRQHLGY